MTAFDDLFTSFMTWLFRLPPSSCKDSILAGFARRCTQCDALFLGSVQLASAHGTRNILWQDLVSELKEGTRRSKWYSSLLHALRARGLVDQVLDRGNEYVSVRKQIGVAFSQYCFHNHLNTNRGTSGDDFRTRRPFGIYPFLYSSSPFESRYLFSFVLSCWKWLDKSACRSYPDFCSFCLTRNTSWHILFDCPVFNDVREGFETELGRSFAYECLVSSTPPVPKVVVKIGKALYFRVKELCQRFEIEVD